MVAVSWPDDGHFCYLHGAYIIALDPVAGPSSPLAWQSYRGAYNDVAALRQLAERCDVLTYEFENVDADGLDAVIMMVSSSRGRTCSAFLKIAFLKLPLKQG